MKRISLSFVNVVGEIGLSLKGIITNFLLLKVARATGCRFWNDEALNFRNEIESTGPVVPSQGR
jgi:hypothetical protein